MHEYANKRHKCIHTLYTYISTLYIVNILFMAPRMVYCSIINLLWSLMSNRVRRFGPSATDLGHVLVSQPNYPAEI